MKRTDEQLRHALARLSPPPADADKREASLRQALSAFSRADLPSDRRAAWTPMLWLGAAAACIMAVIAITALVRAKGSAPGGGNLADVAKPPGLNALFHEMELLFPDHLDAIVTEGGRVDLKISETASATPDDQRVKVSLWHAGRERTVLTFSGRKICMDVDGEMLCFTPLISGDGSVLILTGDQVILPSAPDARDGYRLSAQTLTGRTS